MFAFGSKQIGEGTLAGPGSGGWQLGRTSFIDASGRRVLYLRNPVSHTLGSINSSEHNSPLAASALSSPSPVISRPSF